VGKLNFGKGGGHKNYIKILNEKFINLAPKREFIDE